MIKLAAVMALCVALAGCASGYTEHGDWRGSGGCDAYWSECANHGVNGDRHGGWHPYRPHYQPPRRRMEHSQ